MKKTPGVFQRDHETGLIRDEVTPGCEWVQAGEGIASHKWDGTACLVRNGKLYKRYDAKRGKTPPPGFEPCEAAPDEHTGHFPGWLPVGDGPEDKWFREAWRDATIFDGPGPDDGTYELIGPKINGNPERLEAHEFERHGALVYPDCPRTFEGLRTWLAEREMEGVVFHHPDGRRAKVKARDFGLPWPRAKTGGAT